LIKRADDDVGAYVLIIIGTVQELVHRTVLKYECTKRRSVEDPRRRRRKKEDSERYPYVKQAERRRFWRW